MIEGLKPYPEYKESGHRWLGQVPRRWRLLPLCRVAAQKSESGRTDLELLSVYLHRGVIRYSESGGQVHKPSMDLSKYQVVEPGNFVLNNQQAWRGSIGVSKYLGIISPAYVVMKLSPVLAPGYANYLFRSPVMIAQYVVASRGVGDIQRNIYYPDLRGATVVVPSVEEQAAIVRFLDHANRKIDGFIRAKRKLIGLLNEQKQAIIHLAVTRGLDPDVPLKPSGVPWLGDIPAHWDARRVKQTTRILRGKFSHRPRNDPSFYDGRYPFIQTGAVAKADKFITSYKQTLNEKGLSVSKLFPSGTLVMTIAANIGDVAILTFEACFPDSIVGFVPAGKLDRDYLYFVFLCMKDELLREAPVNTQGNLNIERIGIMRIPLPPLLEQEQITKHVETETIPFNTAITRTEREIALMQEYRTRLTADIVTGKLDVREAAAKLPDLPAEVNTDETQDEIETEEIDE